METLFNSFIDLQKSFQKVMPLAAIWLKSSVVLAHGDIERITPRIEKGDRIRVDDGWIIDIEKDKPATHEVIECRGNIGNTILEMDIKNLETGELSTLKLK